ncbi:hypothetical protein [Desulfoplanes sp.]
MRVQTGRKQGEWYRRINDDDIPLGSVRKAEQTLGVPRKSHCLMPSYGAE